MKEFSKYSIVLNKTFQLRNMNNKWHTYLGVPSLFDNADKSITPPSSVLQEHALSRLHVEAWDSQSNIK